MMPKLNQNCRNPNGIEPPEKGKSTSIDVSRHDGDNDDDVISTKAEHSGIEP